MSITSDHEMYQHIVHDVMKANYELLEAIARNDWVSYEKYVDSTITCFEPEAAGHLIEGTDFHKFYFQQSASSATAKKNKSILASPSHLLPHSETTPSCLNTMARPHVRLLGQHAAVVSYVRLVQFVSENGAVQVKQYEETRIWQNKNMDGWRNVHMHRSQIGTSE